MKTGATIRLPLRARRKRLATLDGQPRGTVYGIAWNAFAMPSDGICYIVQFAGRGRVVILGLIVGSGRVYCVTAPVRDLPDVDKIALMLLDGGQGRGGDVLARRGSGPLEHVGRYAVMENGRYREEADGELTQQALECREFLASQYLKRCVFAVQAPAAARADDAPSPAFGREVSSVPVSLFRDFGQAMLPDAIATLLYRIDARRNPLGIERYARRVLSRVDLQRLRSLAARCEIHLAHIEAMNGFYLNFDRTQVSPEETGQLLGVEAMLNRLAHVLDRMGAGLDPVIVSPSERVCAELDWDGLRSSVAQVDRLLDGSVSTRCAMSAPGTRESEPGGEWDVRMHFTELCEHLNLLVRLEYLFDYRAADGSFSVQFRSPDIDGIPYEAFDAHEGTWRELDDAARDRVARDLACRMALVLAAAAFAASPRVSSCTVEGVGADGSSVAYGFERPEFLVRYVALARRLADEPLEAAAAIAGLRAARISGFSFEPISDPAAHRDPSADDRPLPDELRRLLCADTARDLNVMDPPDDRYRKRLDEVHGLAQVDPDAAERAFNSLIEEIQATCVEAELLSASPMQSQFCENQVQRIVLPLLIDDRNTRIHRVPDALFIAQQELCAMYLQFGALEQALPEARKLLDMAETSMQAHFMLISVLARLNMFDEVIDVAKHGLRVAFDRESIAYLFYRLAFAYWNQGDRLVALACYRLVPAGERVSAIAQEEAGELLRRMGMEAQLGLAQAVGVAQASGIPVPPTPELYNQIADAAVMLMDNGFLHTASRCVYSMWRMHATDELGVLSKSLLWITGT